MPPMSEKGLLIYCPKWKIVIKFLKIQKKKSLGKSNSPWKLRNKAILDKQLFYMNTCFGRVKPVQLENKQFNDLSTLKRIPPKDFKPWNHARGIFLDLLTTLSHSVLCLIPYKQPNVLHGAWKANHCCGLTIYDGKYMTDLLQFCAAIYFGNQNKISAFLFKPWFLHLCICT